MLTEPKDEQEAGIARTESEKGEMAKDQTREIGRGQIMLDLVD